ncbi:hypothetical protein IKF23_03335 [Candidatus Saccharibacteria bacterium]|nr:hypothetical protein [Candidatus Saccharibacteria bacterium]
MKGVMTVAQYTHEEAIEKILQMKEELGHMPTERDYKKDNIVKLEDLEKALNVKGYAALNIAVLKELRKKQDTTVNLLDDAKKSKWKNDFVINPHKPIKVKKKPKTEVKKMEEPKNIATENEGLARSEEPSENKELTVLSDEHVEKRRTGKHQTKEEVAKIVKKFYDMKSRLPTDKEMRDGTFRTICEESRVPSHATCYKYLGKHKEEWLKSIEEILGNDLPNGSSRALEAVILEKKEADKELISEKEYERYRYMDLAKFFETARAVREMVEDGTLKKIQETANRFDFETEICTESDGINLYFATRIKK